MVIGWDGVLVNGYMQIWRGLVVREYGRDAVSGRGVWEGEERFWSEII